MKSLSKNDLPWQVFMLQNNLQFTALRFMLKFCCGGYTFFFIRNWFIRNYKMAKILRNSSTMSEKY